MRTGGQRTESIQIFLCGPTIVAGPPIPDLSMKLVLDLNLEVSPNLRLQPKTVNLEIYRDIAFKNSDRHLCVDLGPLQLH